jgi:ABC-type transporter Mla MlaB component
VYSLSGRIEAEDVIELQRLLALEAAGQQIVFDLHEIARVDQDAVRFLTHCEAEGIELQNCPAYLREWLDMER